MLLMVSGPHPSTSSIDVYFSKRPLSAFSLFSLCVFSLFSLSVLSVLSLSFSSDYYSCVSSNFVSMQRPRRLTEREMTCFHSDEYVNFLRSVTPDNMGKFADRLSKYNVGDDCPVFDGKWQQRTRVIQR